MSYKVMLVYEHEYEDCGEPTQLDIIAEYPIDEIKGDKVMYLPATNKIKKDLLTYIKRSDEDDT